MTMVSRLYQAESAIRRIRHAHRVTGPFKQGPPEFQLIGVIVDE